MRIDTFAVLALTIMGFVVGGGGMLAALSF